MAGMGFELKRIFTKKAQTAQSLRVLHSSLTTLGASLLFVVLLFVLAELLNRLSTSDTQKEFFFSSFIYISLVGIFISSVMNSVLSRYVSDRIIEAKESKVCASLFGSMVLSAIVAALGMGMFCFIQWKNGIADWSLLMLCYAFGIVWTLSHNLMVFASALKKCVSVIGACMAGVIVFCGIMYACYGVNSANIAHGVYIALVCGFFVVDLILVCINRKSLGGPGEDYFDFLGYFKQHAFLWGSGLFFFLGLWISNILYWYFSEINAKVAGMVLAPSYDMAVFMLLLCNFPGLFLFEYLIRKQFYAKYNMYVAAVEEGSFEVIKRENVTLSKAVKLQLIFMYGMQFVISVISVGLCSTVFGEGGVFGDTMELLLPLQIGMAFVFCMYYTITFFCYFSGYKESFIISVVFAVVVAGVAIFCCVIAKSMYALPLLVGGGIGWLVALLLLKNCLKDLNAYMLCK